jgi:hypothetical protein
MASFPIALPMPGRLSSGSSNWNLRFGDDVARTVPTGCCGGGESRLALVVLTFTGAALDFTLLDLVFSESRCWSSNDFLEKLPDVTNSM